jgi:polysaccharide export outer membrane protein
MKALALAFVCAIAFFAAPTVQAQTLTTGGAAVAETPEVSPLEYRLGSGDKLRITVYGEPTLTGEYSVSGTGTISFPLIGDVKALDRTVKDIQSDIEVRLAGGYLRKPQVSAEVLTYRPFYIIGEVNRPG